MFKKKPTIKPLSPLRSSDRRKIADQVISTFDVEVPNNDDAEVKDSNNEGEQAAGTAGLGAVRNSLLPEGTQSARFSTTAGPDLKQVSGTVYVGAHPGAEQRVLWFSVDDQLIPTVYTLWKNPQLVPLLYTQDVVLPKLQGGADLMTPGLTRGPPFPTKAKKGAVVAVASVQKPSVPKWVGTCEIDVSSLQQVQGAKGHAVRGQHWEGDEIWVWSQSGIGGTAAPEEINGWDINDEATNVSSGVKHLSVEDDDDEDSPGGVPVGDAVEEKSSYEPHNKDVEGEGGEPYEKIEVTEKTLTTQEIDDIFWKAFLYAVQHHRNTNRSDPNHGVSFPIHQSLVISNFVLPYLPITTPGQASSLQVKKTSWKNTRKFIKALDKAKIVKSKDRDGGECVILDIDFYDAQVINFVPYKLPKKDTPGADSGGGGGGKAIVAGSSPNDSSVGQRLKLLNLYRPKSQLAPIFEASQSDVRNLYLPTELRTIIMAYIDSEDLVSDTNKRLVNIDPFLANAVFDGSNSLDREVLAKGTVPRDALIERITQSCSPFWALLRNDETRDAVKAKAGHSPKINIILETRSGNKTMTRLFGVEVFHVNPQPLAEELQKACASSTSVNQLVGSSPKNPVQEILVQGPQKDAVVRALGKRGVDRHWIEVQDKTKGKKKP